MYKNLYDSFKHWYRGGQIYFYSDPHFNDCEANLLRKNYIGDEEQVKKINSRLGKNDTLIILGDIGDISFVKKLKGYKVLVMGNHDSGASNYKKQIIFENNKEISNKLFDEVYEGPVIISEKIIISHEPIDLPYMLNIHGHDHNNLFKSKKAINVCAEHINYLPICFKSIVNSGILKNIKTIHRLTIDDASDKKKKRLLKQHNNIINKLS